MPRRVVENRIVVKFGGDALATVERVIAAARFVVYLTKVLGYEVIAVVSAMADTTDDDLALIAKVSVDPLAKLKAKLLRTGEDRAAALLAMAIEAVDPEVHAEAPDTHQAGLLVTEDSGRTRIVGGSGILPFERRLRFSGGQRTVLVFSGFQGVTEERDVVTLDRGSSDLSAVCFAVVFRASLCLLCKAFSGVAVVDPRVVEGMRVKFFHFLTCDAYLDLVTTGVVMANAVEAARDHGVPIFVCRSPSIDWSARDDFRNGKGTLIAAARPSRELEKALPAVAVLNIPRNAVFLQMPGVSAGSPQANRIYRAVGAVVSLLEEREFERGLLFVVGKDDAARAESAIRRVYRGKVIRRDDWAMLTLADRRMIYARGYVSRFRDALGRARVQIIAGWSAGHQIIRIVPRSDLKKAAGALGKEFDLFVP